MRSLNQLVKEFVKSADATDRHTTIADRIIETGETERSHRTVRREVAKYRSSNLKGEIQVVVDRDDEENPKVYVENETYYFRTGSRSMGYGYVKFPVALIDKFFEKYSRHGGIDKTGAQMIAEYELTPQTWNLVKTGLNLQKESDIFSPWTIANTPIEDLAELKEERIAKNLRSKENTLTQYNKRLLREFKRSVVKDNENDLRLTTFMDEFISRRDELKPIYIREMQSIHIEDIDDLYEKKVGCATIADLHMGAIVEQMHRTPQYSSDILKERLKQVSQDINYEDYDEVNIVCLGDLIESFTGLNHSNSWKGVEAGMWGANAVIESQKLLTRFLSDINNFGMMYGVGGNHDRSTSSNKEDVTAETAKLIYHYMNLISEGRVVDLGDIGGFWFDDSEDTWVVPTHGHLGLAKKDGATLSWKYGKQGAHNIHLQGHLHSLIMKNNDFGKDFEKWICPSIFSGNVYSEQGGWDGSAGWMLLEKDRRGRVERRIKSL